MSGLRGRMFIVCQLPTSQQWFSDFSSLKPIHYTSNAQSPWKNAACLFFFLKLYNIHRHKLLNNWVGYRFFYNYLLSWFLFFHVVKKFDICHFVSNQILVIYLLRIKRMLLKNKTFSMDIKWFLDLRRIYVIV